MTFDEVLTQVLALLQRQGRVSYRALKRRFNLDDEYLADLKEELLFASPVKVILPLSTCYTRDLLNALSGGGHHAGQSLRAFCRKKPHLCDGARHAGTRTGCRPPECLV